MDTFYLAASATPQMSFIGWIIVGGLAGWIGSKIMGTDAQMGLLANIVVGVIGGFLGGWVLSFLNFSSDKWYLSFITCLIGACIFLGIVKLFTGKR